MKAKAQTILAWLKHPLRAIKSYKETLVKEDWLTTNSLAFRLFATTMLLSLIVLPFLGYLLVSNHRQTVEKIFDQQLQSQVTILNINLDALVKYSQNIPSEQANRFFDNPTFLAPASGSYWQVSPLNKQCGQVVTSPSLTSDTLMRPKRENKVDKQDLFFDKVGPFGARLRIVEQLITIENTINPACRDYSVMVSGNAHIMHLQAANFLRTLSIALTVLGLGLAFATLLQVHYGLAPLGAIRKNLTDIRNGKADRLRGNYPAEIIPLSHELNNLIDSNNEIIERSRTHVGNLAHALKTPLSVITNETRAEKSPLAQKLTQQAEIMRRQIAHHLDRARMVARVNVIGTVTVVEEAVTPLVRVLNRINEDKGVHIDLTMAQEGLKFQGEKQDLEEMLGNLLENACNWADKKVLLTIEPVKENTFLNQKAICFKVRDDGPGLPEDQLSQVLKRGKRLDESKPGSGLGLSIVADLAELYKGQFYLENMKQGGLCSVLILPIVEG